MALMGVFVLGAVIGALIMVAWYSPGEIIISEPTEDGSRPL